MTEDGGLDARLGVARRDGFTLDLALRIPPGRTAALLGPNGAGKSTAVAALAGLLALDTGHVRLGGRLLEDPSRRLRVPPQRRRVGVVFQSLALLPHLTVLGNVAFGLAGRRGRARRREEGMAWLRRFGLERLAARKPATLSGGEAQQVALARALASRPDLLLLDEPLAALDVTTRAELRRDLASRLGGYAGPRLLITHDPAEAFLLADEIHVVEGGRVVQAGTAEEIRLRPRSTFAADLVGTNLLSGVAADGIVTTGGRELRIAEPGVRGKVLASIHPRAISIHRRRPEGSPRNSWRTTVSHVEPAGERVRLNVGPPLPLTVEVTPEAIEALRIAPGEAVWVSMKATEIRVESA